MPCNLYGPNDNYDLKTSHFFPALIFKALAAKKNKKNELTLWGSGKPKRELMYVDDLADACIYFLNKKTKDSLINIGTGHDKSIFEYAKFILKKINFKCKISLRNYILTYIRIIFMDQCCNLSNIRDWCKKCLASVNIECCLLRVNIFTYCL